MEDKGPPIEPLIAAGYAAGQFSDECWSQVLRRIEKITIKVCRGLRTAVADEVEGKAQDRIRRALERGLGVPTTEIPGAPGLYDPNRSFDAWCRTVVKRCAMDVGSRGWASDVASPHARSDDSALDARVVSMNDVSDGRTPLPSGPLDQQERVARALDLFERLIPAPRTRIIVAVQHDYIALLPDEVVRAWCEAADLGDITASLRQIAGCRGCLKELCDLLPDVSYQNMRVIASRGERLLHQGGLSGALGGDG